MMKRAEAVRVANEVMQGTPGKWRTSDWGETLVRLFETLGIAKFDADPTTPLDALLKMPVDSAPIDFGGRLYLGARLAHQVLDTLAEAGFESVRRDRDEAAAIETVAKTMVEGMSIPLGLRRAAQIFDALLAKGFDVIITRKP